MHISIIFVYNPFLLTQVVNSVFIKRCTNTEKRRLKIRGRGELCNQWNFYTHTQNNQLWIFNKVLFFFFFVTCQSINEQLSMNVSMDYKENEDMDYEFVSM